MHIFSHPKNQSHFFRMIPDINILKIKIAMNGGIREWEDVFYPNSLNSCILPQFFFIEPPNKKRYFAAPGNIIPSV